LNDHSSPFLDYNKEGQLTEQVYRSGRIVKQNYDEAARLVSNGNVSGGAIFIKHHSSPSSGGITPPT